MREMKDSGIEWIGKIPVNWVKTRIGNLFRFSSGDSLTNEEIQDEGLYKVYGANGPRGYYHHTNLAGKHILIGRVGALCGNIHVVDEPVWVTEHALIAKQIFPDVCTDFAGRVFESMNLGQYSKASAQPVIASSAVQRLQIPIPPSLEQRRIADYLDRKCSQIDAIIARQQEVIEKLKAYKLSVITEAVTKGLNPDVPMKNSGIDFIGSIPEAWRICRLRNIGTLQNGISKGGEFFGHGFPFVSYGDVYRNFSLPVQVTGLIDSSDEERRNYSVESGDIFFTRTSETIEEVGFSSVCEETIPDATFAGFLIRVRPFTDDLVSGFAKYYFRSNHHRYYLVKQMNLVTRASLGQDLLKSMPVLVPPKEEQIRIAEYLDKKCNAIETSIGYKQKIVQRLTAYKKSLIYEVVTGKKEV